MTIARAGLALLATTVLACSPGNHAETKQATPVPSLDPARPLPSPLPAVVARVNGQPIALAQILPLAKTALDRLGTNARDAVVPVVMRSSLEKYVERELLLQEALARKISADAHAVDWAYDQARRGYPDEAAWTGYLATQGTVPQEFRAELRAQQTIAALTRQELQAAPIAAWEVRAAYDANPLAFAPKGAQQPPSFEAARADVELALRLSKQGAIMSALVARLREKARIELFL